MNQLICASVSLRTLSRETGSAVPSRVFFVLHTRAESRIYERCPENNYGCNRVLASVGLSLGLFLFLPYFSVPYFGLACDHRNSFLCLEE